MEMQYLNKLIESNSKQFDTERLSKQHFTRAWKKKEDYETESYFDREFIMGQVVHKLN